MGGRKVSGARCQVPGARCQVSSGKKGFGKEVVDGQDGQGDHDHHIVMVERVLRLAISKNAGRPVAGIMGCRRNRAAKSSKMATRISLTIFFVVGGSG